MHARTVIESEIYVFVAVIFVIVFYKQVRTKRERNVLPIETHAEGFCLISKLMNVN